MDAVRTSVLDIRLAVVVFVLAIGVALLVGSDYLIGGLVTAGALAWAE
jgi:hypothetical protein